METPDLARLLADRSVYPGAGGEPELIHTHCSTVALVGDEVYKTKRAVRYAFLDFSTPAARLEACREELRLNARLAPGMYHGLSALRPTQEGNFLFEPFDAAESPPADTIAVAVRMRRLTAHDLLDARLARGEVDHELLGRLAERLAEFHRDAERGPEVDAAADPARLAGLARDNLDALGAWTATEADEGPGPIATASVLAHLRRATDAFFEAHGDRLAARVASGRAVDGHGDLHAGNVWISGEELLVYDALEFDADLRRGDAGLDLAFLLMDLDRAGHRGASAWLAREYARLADDPELELVLDGFKTYRALVRAKVSGLLAANAELSDERRRAAREDGVGFIALACSYALAPSLVLTCGLPASGKSWFAERFARALGLSWHRSDVRRRQVESESGGDADARYAADAKQRTYDALLTDARRDLVADRGVIADASFLQAAWRAPFVALAQELGAPFALVEPRLAREEARARLERRAHDSREPSEADWAVYQRLEREYEAPDELPEGTHVVLAGDADAPDALLALLDALARART